VGAKEGYTGKERDAETGLDYFGARYYLGAIGRWGAVDRFTDKYPGLSPYGYAANNPLLYIDVNGDSLYAEHSYRTGFLGLFGKKITERAVYRDGAWYQPGTNTAYSGQSSTMRRLMSQSGSAISAMFAAGGDAAAAAGLIVGHSTRNTLVRNGANGFEGGRIGDVIVTLSGGSGLSGYENLLLSDGTGAIIADGIDAAVHEFGHVYDALQGFNPSQQLAISNMFGPAFGYDEKKRPISWGEAYGVHIENVVRGSRGHALRAYYGYTNGQLQGQTLIPGTRCSNLFGVCY
jgi:RHS repeat-associated protein